MKKPFLKEVGSAFADKLGTAFPILAEKTEYIFPGEKVFIVPTNSPSLAGYFVITPDHHGRNRFSLDIGWSTLGRFPQLPRRPYGTATESRLEFKLDEFTCRLSTIWGEADFWWQEGVIGDCITGSGPIELASHATGQIMTHGVSYLECFFSSRGLHRVEPN